MDVLLGWIFGAGGCVFYAGNGRRDTRKQGKQDNGKAGKRGHLAPEGRHVYSTRHAPKTPKPQRGDRYHLSQSRIKTDSAEDTDK